MSTHDNILDSLDWVRLQSFVFIVPWMGNVPFPSLLRVSLSLFNFIDSSIRNAHGVIVVLVWSRDCKDWHLVGYESVIVLVDGEDSMLHKRHHLHVKHNRQ